MVLGCKLRSFHWQLWMEVSLDGFETWQGSHHDRVNSSLTDFRAHCSELYIKDLQNRAILSQMNCCIFFKQGLLQIFKSLPSRCFIHLFIGRIAPAKEIYVAPFGPVDILRCNIEKEVSSQKGWIENPQILRFFFFRP